MKRWLAIQQKDGSTDKYAIALVTHTVSRTFTHGKATFEAWRFDTEPATLLGSYPTAEAAKGACESDSKARAAA